MVKHVVKESIMICNVYDFLSNSLRVFYPLAKAQGKKPPHNSLDKNHHHRNLDILNIQKFI